MKCDYWSGRLYPVINQIEFGRSSLFCFGIGIPELCPVSDCDSCYDKFSFTDCCELELVGKDALGDFHNLGIGYPDVVAIDGGCLTLGRNSQGKIGFFIYKGTKKIPPYRAYLTVNKVSSSRLLEIDDEEPTTIQNVNRYPITNNQWYTLDGRKLDGKPTTKGMYIVNGRKEVAR